MTNLATQWLRQISLCKSSNTYRIYSQCINEFFASHPVLTPDTLLSYIEELRSRSASTNTIVLKLSIIRGLLNYMADCGETGEIRRMLGITRSVHGETKAQASLSYKQAMQLIDAAKGLRYKVILSICCFTGMRIGEVLSIRRSDCDTSTITIRGTKTHQDRSVRILSDDLREILGRYLRCSGDSNLIFEGVRQNSVQKYTKHLAESLGMTGVHLHTLRRLFITKSFENNVPLPVIMSQVGHRNPQNTLRYTVITDEQFKNAYEMFKK